MVLNQEDYVEDERMDDAMGFLRGVRNISKLMVPLGLMGTLAYCTSDNHSKDVPQDTRTYEKMPTDTDNSYRLEFK